jgi:hypothetical protein
LQWLTLLLINADDWHKEKGSLEKGKGLWEKGEKRHHLTPGSALLGLVREYAS